MYKNPSKLAVDKSRDELIGLHGASRVFHIWITRSNLNRVFPFPRFAFGCKRSTLLFYLNRTFVVLSSQAVSLMRSLEQSLFMFFRVRSIDYERVRTHKSRCTKQASSERLYIFYFFFCFSTSSFQFSLRGNRLLSSGYFTITSSSLKLQSCDLHQKSGTISYGTNAAIRPKLKN